MHVPLGSTLVSNNPDKSHLSRSILSDKRQLIQVDLYVGLAHTLFTTSLMVVFATARKLKAMLIGNDSTTVTSDAVISDLKAASVPISFADCRICPDPCDEGALYSDVIHISQSNVLDRP